MGLIFKSEIFVTFKELSKDKHGSLLFEAISELQDKDFLPLLKTIYQREVSNTKTATRWIEDLENCIKQLEKVTNN